jgi:hypothetical protein
VRDVGRAGYGGNVAPLQQRQADDAHASGTSSGKPLAALEKQLAAVRAENDELRNAVVQLQVGWCISLYRSLCQCGSWGER